MANEKSLRGRPTLPDEKGSIQIPHRVWLQTAEALREIASLTGKTAGTILNGLIAKELDRLQSLEDRKRKK